MSSNKTISPNIGPRFCPTCERESSDERGGPLCADCGETLIPQGYCPICERYWRMPAGNPCPKHEVALESEPPSSSGHFTSGQPISWVTVWKFPDSLAAAAPRIRLEAEGIPTFLEGERMGSPSMYRVAIGGVKLQVPVELADEARVILSQSWSLPFGDEDDDYDDDGNETHPEPSPVGRSLTKDLILLLLIAPALMWLLWRILGHH